MLIAHNIMFSTAKMLRGVMSLVFPKGSRSQTPYDVGFAGTPAAPPSNRTCQWSVMTPGKECHPSCFPIHTKSLRLGADYVPGVLLQISCLGCGILFI